MIDIRAFFNKTVTKKILALGSATVSVVSVGVSPTEQSSNLRRRVKGSARASGETPDAAVETTALPSDRQNGEATV
jgi:hypothetical protein